MPRYENGTKFIDIRLHDSTVATISGRIGGTFKTREAWFPAPELAVARFLEDIAAAKAKEFVHISQLRAPAQNRTLEAQILERLDDDDARIVYGDWLLERGDPRGELAALQRQIAVARPAKAQSLRRREAEVVEDHSSLLFGTLDEIPRRSTVLVATWRLGFLDAVTVGLPDAGNGTLPGVRETTEQLVALHSTRFLRAIAFDSATNYRATLRELAPLSGTLESLAVTTAVSKRGTLGNLGRFCATHRRLRRLVIDVASDPIEGLELPDLEHLELGSASCPTQLEVIAQNVWPALTSLAFAPWYQYVAPRVLDALLTRDRFPRLTTLTLLPKNVEVATSICDALVRSMLIDQLARLVVLEPPPEVMAVFRRRIPGPVLSFASRTP